MVELAVNPVKIGTLRRLTADHPFFAGWDLERLKTVEPHCRVVDVTGRATVLELGTVDPYTYLLLAGTVTLRDAGGNLRRVNAGDLDARFPIAHLRPSRYSVRARAGTRLIRMERSALRGSTPARGAARFLVADTSVGGSWQSHPLVDRLIRKAREGALEIPSMPAIAGRIRRALASERGDLAAVAAIVGADPAIAGRLIQVANSAAFGGRSRCESVQAALVRLGLERAQNIVLVLATRELFRSGAVFLKERMVQRWRRAIDLAALAGVLCRLTPGLDADRGLLIGLLHEIGALPILRLAADHPDLADHPLVLDEIVAALTPEVSRRVLEGWGMPEAFIDAAINRGNWFRDHEGGADYTDVLVVAHLHRLVRERTFRLLPRIDETPAFGKLALGLLSPQLSLLVLDEARSQVQELKALLG